MIESIPFQSSWIFWPYGNVAGKQVIIDPLVVYHANCRDGFCAAWMAWRVFGHRAEYKAMQYGDKLDVRNQDIFILDFSFPSEDMRRLIDHNHYVRCLDHHKTAAAELAPFVDNVEFDMNRSGAAMARDFFHPGLECWLVDYVQDRDLWQWKLPQSKAINAFISTLPDDFLAWDKTWGTTTLADAIMLGNGAESYKDRQVERNVELAHMQRFLGYDNIPVVNTTGDTSEIVGKLAEYAPFAVGWFRKDGQTIYSLRSRGDFDVAVLAQKVGGGGHKNAAGFKSSFYPEELCD